MRRVLAVVLTIAGVFLGLWLGIWILFIGGIVSIVEAAKANPVDAYQLAWGILKVVVASPVGLACAWLGFGLGSALMEDE